MTHEELLALDKPQQECMKKLALMHAFYQTADIDKQICQLATMMGIPGDDVIDLATEVMDNLICNANDRIRELNKFVDLPLEDVLAEVAKLTDSPNSSASPSDLVNDLLKNLPPKKE